ncbi:DUF2793 domain-containing protein [Aliiruegeria sabulilitoris]|uniref:DUF2793 domain-containing protein n=1 Tax=Aliiruegeria sabulilitoris TaxID=1510458 RepID=UPI0008379BD1|nr:DUF2793 domain-containing protein [Aliiruegeria sabulilitoris]
MSETTNLSLPFIMPSQAQKHVTVNEALVKLDALAQIALKSRSLANPPSGFDDGDCYSIPAGAGGNWNGADGMIAIASNGGWVFVTPREGWNAWIADEFQRATYIDGQWILGMLAGAQSGAASHFMIGENEYDIVAGDAQTVGLEIPANAVVFACSARVVEEVTGTMSSWSLDLEDGSITFGSGVGVQQASYCTGILSQPTAVYARKSVRISPVDGSFSGGKLRLAAHFYRVSLPV